MPITFEDLNLNSALLKALDELGYVHPTPIQQQVFPVAMSGKDVLGIAQTGTGKTFAYLLPILRKLKYSEQKHPRVLIIVPTRELVLQIIGEIEKLTKYVTVRYEGIYGGTNINTQKQRIYNGIDILVATPGRLVDIANTGILRLKSLQTLVVDEVDKMFDLGFRTELVNFLDSLPERRQNLMFSATVNEDIEKILSSYFLEPLKIEVAAHGTPLERITQLGYYAPNFTTKIDLLQNLLKDQELSKVLVFGGNRILADRIFEAMEKINPGQQAVIHSYKSHNHRVTSLRDFEEGKTRVLIATDIIARGMDISDVTHVINFDTPKVPEDYIHRVGRTGRANKDGVAITFINEPEREYQETIEVLMNKRITMVPLPADVKVSTIFSEDERANTATKKKPKKEPALKKTKGAFHEKKEKNKKINLGGPSKKQAGKKKTARYFRKND
jgi:ATP-dependent RNA helicase RhlE